MGSVNYVLSNLLNRIKDSGLYDYVNDIYLIINGNKDSISIDLSDTKYHIINEYKDVSNHEFPTLDLISKHSQQKDFNLLYLHTKGVSRPNQKSIEDWVNYMSYFNINKWEDRIKELNDNDCTGVNFGGNPDDIKENPSLWGYGKAPMHYSGNFWWSKSSHIRKLPNPYMWVPNQNYGRWRIMNEMWLCQIPNAKYYCAWKSNIDHYQTNYPKELYEN